MNAVRATNKDSGMKHERLCQSIVDGAHEAVIFADRVGVIRLWNGGAEAMFGHAASEAIGRSLDLIIPERLRSRHWDGYAKVMSNGETRYGRELLAVPAQRRDGERISIEFTMVLLRDEVGEVSGAAALIRDVTSRWQRERARERRLAELEAQLASPASRSAGG